MVTAIESAVDATGSASEASSSTTGFTQVFNAVISNQQNEPTSINSEVSAKTEGSRNNAFQKAENEQDESEASAPPIAVPLIVVSAVPLATAEAQIGNDGLAIGTAAPSASESLLSPPCLSNFAESPKSHSEPVQSPKIASEVEADASSGVPTKPISGDFECTPYDNASEVDRVQSENAGWRESSNVQRQPGPEVLAALPGKAESVIPTETLHNPESHASPAECSSEVEQPIMPPQDARPRMKAILKVRSSDPTPVLEQSNATATVESESAGAKPLQGSPTSKPAAENTAATQEGTTDHRKSQVPASPSSDIGCENLPAATGDVQRSQSAAALHASDTAVTGRQTATKSSVQPSDGDPVSNIGSARETSATLSASVLTAHSLRSSGSAEPPGEASAKPGSPVSGPEPSTRVPEGFVPGGNHLLLRLERQEMRFGWNTPEFGHVEVRATVEHDRIGAVVAADSRLCDSLQSDLGSLSRALSSHSLELGYFQTSNFGSHGNAERDRSLEFSGDSPAATSNLPAQPEKIHETVLTFHSGALDLRA